MSLLWPSMKRALRLVSIGLALAAGPAALPAALSVLAVGGITATASQAGAQTSGGYSRPGGGGSYGGVNRRPSIGGGFGGPSASAFGGFGGGDLAISRRASSEALRNYRGSQVQPPALTSRRPSSGWDDGGWGTAPLPRRPPSAGWGGSAYAPRYIIIGANNVGFELFRRLPQRGFLGFFDFRSADRLAPVIDHPHSSARAKDPDSFP